MVIGIRREDKNIWEKRTPLTPDDVRELIQQLGIKILVQPSEIRIFKDSDYEKAGAVISEDLSEAEIIFGVKEVPVEKLLPEKTYVFFAHVIKGQKHNMPMLKRLMELKCNLIDYERIVDEQGKRLIFFGKYAGYAGLIETLHALGKKLKLLGINNPFSRIKQPYEYSGIEEAKDELREVGNLIQKEGLPEVFIPFTIGFAGYGNVSKGAQEFFDLLPHVQVSPSELIEKYDELKKEKHRLIKIVFKEEDTVRRKFGEFNLQEFFNQPEHYESKFDIYLDKLRVLVNCIFWTEKYPRLVTKKFLLENPEISKTLLIIGDISCDIEGAIEITYRATQPDLPCFTFNPFLNEFTDDVQKDGITVMAVDNLPCEFARESSSEFSKVLKQFIPQILSNHFDKDFSEINLPYPIKKAMILHKGQLTDEYKYIEKYLREIHT
ncbi:MAG: bifunctional lysine ketoglutarate reductase /saccharopine dehydrogenase family protein [Ignavibacteria bacterium]|nr:bifunctional lysine ketoglutarate reductase /saccharopine dehydrogenase family protein [Ignavibacteria bacterium]